ncbi:MAG: proton-conducting membrane transporter, partial [Eubacterium sp.]|nr:proton-conducting membrane transporter [Eubacterium sp.]
LGSLQTDVGILSWIGPAVLLVSALLTAGYLLPVTMKGFFPGEDYDYPKPEKEEPSWRMLLPMVLMTILAVVLGMFPGILLEPAQLLAGMVL